MADDSLIRHENLVRLGLSAKELSERVGGRYTYWRDMLAGKKSFGEKIARKIEDKLQLPLDIKLFISHLFMSECAKYVRDRSQ